MAKFKVVWPTKKEIIVERSDCETLDEFINSYFGSAGVIGDTKVTKVGEPKKEEPKKEEPKKEEPKKEEPKKEEPKKEETSVKPKPATKPQGSK